MERERFIEDLEEVGVCKLVYSFVVKPNANKGKKSKKSVISGYEGTIDDYLRKNVTNSEVIFERLQGVGYPGIRHSSPIHPILHPFQSESKSTYNAQSTSL